MRGIHHSTSGSSEVRKITSYVTFIQEFMSFMKNPCSASCVTRCYISLTFTLMLHVDVRL